MESTPWQRAGRRAATLYVALTLAASALLATFARIATRTPSQRLPEGRVIVIANHTSFVDGLLLAVVCRRLGRSLRLLATAGVFRAPVIGALVRRLGFIPVQRGTSRAGESLASAVQALRAGEAVGLFPEGRLTRDPEHWPEQARTGAVRLALATGAPIVPVAIQGAPALVGHGQHLRRLVRNFIWSPQVEILVGEPIDVASITRSADGTVTVRWVADQVTALLVAQLEELRGEQATHRYGVPAAA